MAMKRLLVALLLMSNSGCDFFREKHRQEDQPKQEEQAGAIDADSFSEIHTQLTSAHRSLTSADAEVFKPGRAKKEVLEDVQWRGDYELGSEYRGQPIEALSYNLVTEIDPIGDEGEVVWAIFIDGKFDRFVPWPEPDLETVDYNGSRLLRAKPVRIGDFERLFQAARSEAVSLSDLEAELKSSTPPPEQTDVGLTIAWNLFGSGIPTTTLEDFTRNAALRDQFNAARLNIGMTDAEVDGVLKVKALREGAVEAGYYKVYGSDESVNVFHPHYSNTLVLFRDGKVVGIYSGESMAGGKQWNQVARETFADFP